MKRDLLNVYVCPVTHSALKVVDGDPEETTELHFGELISEGGQRYEIRDGIPAFGPSGLLTELERQAQAEYDASAEQKYDAALDWQFASFYEDEDAVRERMIDILALRPDARVLEIGCGTGRDSFRIARRLDRRGEFFVQDLSQSMVTKARQRLEGVSAAAVEYFASTARLLPFADGFLDAVFHFGGFNNFGESKATLREMTRVVKKGGHVVFGDESLPPWLEGTEFGEIVVTNNPLFKHKAPLECLPENAREVVLRWVLGGCFYLIDFKVGDGPPPLDMDLPHKGWRGGTMRTRYYGRLEGVTPDAKQMAIAAARAEGLSLHEWLDRLVREGARSVLGGMQESAHAAGAGAKQERNSGEAAIAGESVVRDFPQSGGKTSAS